MRCGGIKSLAATLTLWAGVTVIDHGAVRHGGTAHGQVVISDRAVGEPTDSLDDLPVMVESDAAPDAEPTTGQPALLDADTAAPDLAVFHDSSCGCDACCKVQCQDPPGLFQVCRAASGARWTARLDALLLWRNAPRNRPLFSTWNQETLTAGDTVIDANDLDSTMGAGPRISLFRTDCHGHTTEFTYFQAFDFRADKATPPSNRGYTILPAGIYGNTWADLDSGSAELTSGIKSFEANGRKCLTSNISLLGGFRWVEWRESVSVVDTYRPLGSTSSSRDLYDTSTMNSLYGGQIGFDARMFDRGWLRIDATMKGGAYYNIAAQQSIYRNGPVGEAAGLVGRTYQDGGTAAFVGELGFMGTIPLTDHFEFTFGYLGLWLESLAQPINQFGSQRIIPDETARGTLDTTGGTVLQGVTLGFNAKW
jgi:hypothetical protein